jgi:hypothetical protein
MTLHRSEPRVGFLKNPAMDGVEAAASFNLNRVVRLPELNPPTNQIGPNSKAAQLFSPSVCRLRIRPPRWIRLQQQVTGVPRDSIPSEKFSSPTEQAPGEES